MEAVEDAINLAQATITDRVSIVEEKLQEFHPLAEDRTKEPLQAVRTQPLEEALAYGEECPADCPLRTYNSSQGRTTLSTSDHVLHQSTAVQNPESIYKPIKHLQTRVLRLKRGKLYSELVGYLMYVNIDPDKFFAYDSNGHTIQYLALSYTWGERGRSHYMRCNGVFIPIRQNLWVALQHLRSESQDRNIWIDAVCVNQSNNAEMSHQVAGMSPIYRSALQTIVWLGDSGEHTELCFQYLRDHGASKIPDLPRDRHSSQCRKVIPCLIQGLNDIYNRPWFRRVWVRREIWASIQIIVACGNCRISWVGFMRGYHNKPSFLSIDADTNTLLLLSRLADAHPHQDLMRRLTLKPVQHGVDATNGKDSNSLSKAAETPIPADANIVNVLNAAVACESSDPRDRVYALLDMSSARIRRPNSLLTGGPSWMATLDFCIEVDYSKSVSTVFADVARYVLRSERNLNLLYTQARFGAMSDLKLPSWVPDWRHGIQVSACYDRNQRVLHRSHNWRTSLDAGDIGGEGNTLICGGHRVGTIEKIEDIPAKDTLPGLYRVDSRTHTLPGTYRVDSRTHKIAVVSAAGPPRIRRKSEDKPNKPTQVEGNNSLVEQNETDSHGHPGLYSVADEDAEKWIVRDEAKQGDVVVFFEGGLIPFLIRRTTRFQEFQLIGPAISSQQKYRLEMAISKEQEYVPNGAMDWAESFAQSEVLLELGERDRDMLEHFSLV